MPWKVHLIILFNILVELHAGYVGDNNKMKVIIDSLQAKIKNVKAENDAVGQQLSETSDCHTMVSGYPYSSDTD